VLYDTVADLFFFLRVAGPKRDDSSGVVARQWAGQTRAGIVRVEGV
jgi:hypothetical protein